MIMDNVLNILAILFQSVKEINLLFFPNNNIMNIFTSIGSIILIIIKRLKEEVKK